MLRRFALLLAPFVIAQAMTAGNACAQPRRKLTTQELAEWIDERVAAEDERARATAPAVVDDGTFLRRLFLDLQGRIPSVAQSRDFEAEQGSFKRQDYVDRLLYDDSRKNRFAGNSAENLARIWRRMMVPASSPGAAMAPRIEPWLAKQFTENTPYDELAKRLVLATPPHPMRPGPPNATEAADPDSLAGVFQQAVGATPENLTGAFTRVLLGVRLNCAQCHDHPFTDWKQRDFWGLAALFQPVAGEAGAAARPVPMIRPQGEAQQTFVAKLLWADEPLRELPPAKSPREVLDDWLVALSNPNFAATAVNRIWQHLCGRGLSGSVDDLDRVTPEERRVLDEMAGLFVAAGYDMRWLIAGICKSKIYQHVAVADAVSAGLIRRPLKTLSPEQVFDSLEVALGLPVGKSDNGPRYGGERQQFVARMNEAAPESPADYHAGIPQALMLMNGRLTADATQDDEQLVEVDRLFEIVGHVHGFGLLGDAAVPRKCHDGNAGELAVEQLARPELLPRQAR